MLARAHGAPADARLPEDRDRRGRGPGGGGRGRADRRQQSLGARLPRGDRGASDPDHRRLDRDPDHARLDQGGADEPVLLRRRAGDQVRDGEGRALLAPTAGAAGDRRGGRHAGAGAGLSGGQRLGGRPAAGMADPHRHRHRLRPGAAGRRGAPRAHGPAHLPAGPGGGRRPGRGGAYRHPLHRPPEPAAAGRSAGGAGLPGAPVALAARAGQPVRGGRAGVVGADAALGREPLGGRGGCGLHRADPASARGRGGRALPGAARPAPLCRLGGAAGVRLRRGWRLDLDARLGRRGGAGAPGRCGGAAGWQAGGRSGALGAGGAAEAGAAPRGGCPGATWRRSPCCAESASP